MIIDTFLELLKIVAGALLGSIATYFISKHNEKKKHESEIINSLTLLKSEYENNASNLEKFEEKYLKLNILNAQNKEKNGIYLDFYKNLLNFPKISHNNWEYVGINVHDIFNENQIKDIIDCNNKCDGIMAKSKILHEKSKNKTFVNNLIQDNYSDEKYEAQKDIMEFEGELSEVKSKCEIILIYINAINQLKN